MVVLLGYISLKIFDLVFVMTRGGPGVSSDFPSILLFDSAGYILSKWRFRGADTLFAVLLFGMFIPYQAILIPLVNLLQQLHLYDSLVGLAVTNIVYGIPITSLIFRNYHASIPPTSWRQPRWTVRESSASIGG